MIELGLALVSFAAALVLVPAAGGAPRGQAAAGIGGLVLLGVAAIASLALDCDGCTPEVGVWLGAFAIGGWLVGVTVTLVARRVRLRRPRRSSVVVASAAMLLVATLVAYGRGSLNIVRWGCPSNDDLNRIQSVEEVAGAFAFADKPLEPIPLPAWLPPREPAYRGARAFRYVGVGATAYVLVCRQRCAISWNRFAEAREIGEQQWRLGLGSNNNVPIWVTEDYHRAGTGMLDAISEPLRVVQPGIEYGSRCYIR